MRAHTLLEIARRNDYALPADTVEGLAALYEFTDFRHFIEVWILTTNALQEGGGLPPDGRRLRGRGGVARRRLPRGHLQPGRARAPRLHVGGRLRGRLQRRAGGEGAARRRDPPDARHPARLHAGRGARDGRVVGALPRPRRRRASGSAGSRRSSRRSRTSRRSRSRSRSASARCRTRARSPAPRRCAARSRRSAPTGCATASAPRRTRGSCASSPAAAPCSTSARSRTSAPGAVASLADHPLPRLAAAGVRCSISTDDPAMFDTDLGRDYEAATSFGLDPRSFYEAGVHGALCDEETRARLRRDRRGATTGPPLESLDFAHGDCERSRAGRLAERGQRGGPRPRGPARHLPQHADHARRRGARAHPLPPGQDPRLVLHGPRQRGRRRRRRDRDGARGRRHAAAPRHGRAHRARRRAVADLRAVHGPRRTGRRTAATATCTWPTRSSG